MEEDSKWTSLKDKITSRIGHFNDFLKIIHGDDLDRRSLVGKISELKNVLCMMNEVENDERRRMREVK